ncbi:MAG TPA: hypothetical protein VGK88_00530 [bacterium]
MIDIAALLLISAIAYGVGKQVLAHLGTSPQERVAEFAFAIALGLGVLAYAVLALGLAGGLYPAAAALVLLAAALWGYWPRAPMPPAPRRPMAAPDRDVWVWVVAIIVVVAALANFTAAYAPPTGDDALSYHLAAPKIWLHDHRMTPLPWRWATYGPMNVEMLSLLGMLLHLGRLPSLFLWLFGVITVLGFWGLFGGRRRPFIPLVAGAILYVGYLVAKMSSAGQIDLGLACYALLATAAFLTFLRTGEERWVVLSGICAGLAAGTKYTGAVIVVLLIAAVYLVAAIRGRGAWRAVVQFALPAVVLAAPWYLRSLIETGDPVYPFFTALREAGPFRTQLLGLSERYRPGWSLRELAFTGGRLLRDIGPVYGGFLPASVLAWRAPRSWVMWALIAGFGTIWLLTAANPRFLLPVLPLAAAMAALGFDFFQQASPRARRVARTALLVGLIAGAVVTVRMDTPFVPVAYGWETSDQFLRRTLEFYPDIAWMNEHLPEGARVLFFPRGGFYLDRTYVGIGTTTQTGDFATWMRARGVTHVYCFADHCGRVERSGVPYTVLHTGEVSIELRREDDEPTRVRTAVLELRTGP